MSENFIDMQVSMQGSTMGSMKTQAALRRFAVALETALKIEAPINKRGTAPKLRPSIKVRAAGDIQSGFVLTATANDTVRYVVNGTVAHDIRAKNAAVLAWPGGTNSARLGSISGFNGKSPGDLRSLVRSAYSAGATASQGTAFATQVHHPGTSANDFISRAYLMVGPELSRLADDIGDDAADEVAKNLSSLFSGMSSVRI